MTLRLGLLGHPVSHSLSPRIHRAFGAQQGAAVDYRLVDVEAAGLPDAMRELYDDGLRGANVTVPYKALALEHCGALSAGAHAAGAVNTLVRESDGWRGDNTDGPGLVADLQRLDWGPRGQSLLLLGAGGAARGVIPALLAAGVRRIAIHNRTPVRAAQLADRLNDARVETCDIGEHSRPAFDLLLDATSAGHRDQLPLPPDFEPDPGTRCYDMNYGGAAEPLRRWACAHDLAFRDGLGMLVAQAAESYRLWTGFRPEVEPVIDALR